MPGVADKIVEMAMNGSGVRDTSRVLGISVNTVIAHLKNSPHRASRRFPLCLFCTDDWDAYERLIPCSKHITKRYTQSIERQNLNFRTRIKRLQRKTICFSKSIEIHDKVIGEFIHRQFFQFV